MSAREVSDLPAHQADLFRRGRHFQKQMVRSGRLPTTSRVNRLRRIAVHLLSLFVGVLWMTVRPKTILTHIIGI